jgi:hypothetical protein
MYSTLAKELLVCAVPSLTPHAPLCTMRACMQHVLHPRKGALGLCSAQSTPTPPCTMTACTRHALCSREGAHGLCSTQSTPHAPLCYESMHATRTLLARGGCWSVHYPVYTPRPPVLREHARDMHCALSKELLVCAVPSLTPHAPLYHDSMHATCTPPSQRSSWSVQCPVLHPTPPCAMTACTRHACTLLAWSVHVPVLHPIPNPPPP